MKRMSAPKDAQNNSRHNTNTVSPTKHELALYDLLRAGTLGISKLTELSSYGETCLPTTISELGAQGFVIARERRSYTHRHGCSTYFTWYWLATFEEAIKAVHRINTLRAQRKVGLIPDALAERFACRFPAPCESGVLND